MMTKSLEERFKAFLDQLDGSVDIDATFSEAQLDRKKRADYLLNDRQIVLEMKALKDDPEYKIVEQLDKLRDEHKIPVFYGALPLDYILRNVPTKNEVKRKVFTSMLRAVHEDLENANRQIRNTKHTLNLPSACGAMVILNEKIEIIDPRFIHERVSSFWLKRKSSGELRYTEIQFVWYISDAHGLDLVSGERGLTDMIVIMPTIDKSDDNLRYLESLQSEWAKFEGLPFYEMGEPMNIHSLPFVNRSGESVITFEEAPVTKDPELWQANYMNHPHLRELNDSELVERACSVLNKLKPYLSRNRILAYSNDEARLREQYTHILVEARYRRMDLTKALRQLGRNSSGN